MSAAQVFRFVQFEIPWAPGPPAGRYVIREHLGEPPGHVLVVTELSTSERRRLRRRRAYANDPEPEPRQVPTWRITLIDAVALASDAAGDWLRGADEPHLVRGAVARINGVLHAHRCATADPAARDLAADQALVVRVGYGVGEQVADGVWERANTLPASASAARQSRGTAALRPQERLAALLGGRDAALACEELALRARADVDAGREREAALQLQVALHAALQELQPWRETGDLADRLHELDGLRAAVENAAQSALHGGLQRTQAEAVAGALLRLEAALRARTQQALA